MGSRLIRILSLARLIIIDGLRRYALIGLIIFALAGQAGGLLFIDFIPRDVGRASNDFLLSIIWITGFIFLLFHAVHATAWDDGRRVIHTFLARPISRTEYVLGIFTGLSLLLLLLNLILAGIGWFLLNSIKNSVEIAYFQYLSLSFFVLTMLGMYCIELMILAVIIFFSAAVRGNFPVLLLTLSYYLTCYGLPVVREAIGNQTTEDFNQGLNLVLKWTTAIFPDFSRLDFKTHVTAGDSVTPFMEFVPSFGLSLIYIIIVLWFASLLYQRRDLM